MLDSYRHADNIGARVEELVRPIVAGADCLIVTGYQDFLTAMALILEYRPDIKDAPAGTVRILFGENTGRATTIRRKGSLSEMARRHWLGSRGLSLQDTGDLRAVLALEAVKSGAIDLRIYDAETAAAEMGRPAPARLHAKIIAGAEGAAAGSANFSRAGLRHNIEYMDFQRPGQPEYEDRCQKAEQFWRYGASWKKEAIEILSQLLRFVTPQEAACRSHLEMLGFRPWMVGGKRIAGRDPLQYQVELVYEAAATVYEHGIAFIEAPAGAGKTDIGLHLARVLETMMLKTLFVTTNPEALSRKGVFAIAPPAVTENWGGKDMSGLKIVPLSKFSETHTETIREAHRLFRESAIAIVDECHRLYSRWTEPSRRSRIFDESPAVWSTFLSATLLGNHGVDSLVAFHEARASIYMPDEFARGMSRIFQDEFVESEAFDFFGEMSLEIRGGKRPQGRSLTAAGRQKLVKGLGPFICRRTRNCVGESRKRGSFQYPPAMPPERIDFAGTQERKQQIREIARAAEAITGSGVVVTEEVTRVGSATSRAQDQVSLTTRNFLNLLRSSVEFARWDWSHGLTGEKLRKEEEKKLPGADEINPDAEPLFEMDTPRTQNCDEISEMINDQVLGHIDAERVDKMCQIIIKHGQVVFLAERIPVLLAYAELVQQRLGKTGDVFTTVTQNNKKKKENEEEGTEDFLWKVLGRSKGKDKLFNHTRYNDTAKAQKCMSLNAPGPEAGRVRAMFMTYQRAEGINLQQASAVVMVGVISDIKSLVQGMGRIDRIDSLHEQIHYYTFDLSGLTFTSDRIALERLGNARALLGSPDPGPADIPAGDLPGEVFKFIREKRVPRREHFHDTMSLLRAELPELAYERVRQSKPSGVWGADLCLVTGKTPHTLFVLKGRDERDERSYWPPRLIAVDQEGRTIRSQVKCANLLLDAYQSTVQAGLHETAPTGEAYHRTVKSVEDRLSGLTHWDIRPERTVALLATLAEFLGDGAGDDGRTLFVGFDLPWLEYLADLWARELDETWINLKSGLREKVQREGVLPDYLSVRNVLQKYLADLDSSEADRKRAWLQQEVDEAADKCDGVNVAIMDRVSIVFHCEAP